jgi:hypothetical protein
MVNRVRTKVAKLPRAVRVALSHRLRVDTKVSNLLVIHNNQRAESVVRAELRAVTPRDNHVRASSAGDVSPVLGRSVFDVLADDGAGCLELVVAGGDFEVVVAARLVFGAVAGEVLDGPGQAVDFGLAAGSVFGGDGRGGALGGAGLRGLGGGRGCGSSSGLLAAGFGRARGGLGCGCCCSGGSLGGGCCGGGSLRSSLASLGRARGGGCHQGQSTVGRDAVGTAGVAVSRVASIGGSLSSVSLERASESTGGSGGQSEEDAVVHGVVGEKVLVIWLLSCV